MSSHGACLRAAVPVIMIACLACVPAGGPGEVSADKCADYTGGFLGIGSLSGSLQGQGKKARKIAERLRQLADKYAEHPEPGGQPVRLNPI